MKNFISRAQTVCSKKQCIKSVKLKITSFESGIVYGYTCPSCQLAYVGSTKNVLLSRVLAHKGVSSRTERPLSNPSFSAIRNHLNETCNITNVSINNFKILYRGKTESDIRIAESMYIA